MRWRYYTEEPAMDEPETRKRTEATDDRARPAERIGLFAGEDALPMLRRFLWGAFAVGVGGLVLAGVALWRFWFVPDYLRQIQQLLGR